MHFLKLKCIYALHLHRSLATVVKFLMGATRGSLEGPSAEDIELRLIGPNSFESLDGTSPEPSKQRAKNTADDLHCRDTDPGNDDEDLEDFSKDFQTESGPVPELAFLKYCLSLEDLEEVREALSDRLSSVSTKDFAAEYSRLTARDIALKRIPAIMMTLSLELLVGLVIASFSSLLRKVGMFTT